MQPTNAPNRVPVAIVAALIVGAQFWNSGIGLSWRPDLPILLVGPVILLALAAIYSTVKTNHRLAEATLYLGLWTLYPIFATRLTYLPQRLGFPLQDHLLAQLDSRLGFSWIAWARFVLAHRLVLRFQEFAYTSYFWQPVASVIIFASWGPGERNREFLTSVLLALLATIAISTCLPAIGPADSHGINTPSGEVMRALRAEINTPLPYLGIVCFPSFHTVMAILFALAHRGNRWSFPIFVGLNVIMLSAIPYSGDHYLSDVVSGAAVAVGAFAAGRWVLKTSHGRPAIA